MKVECLKCKDTGIIEYWPLDGMSHYRWVKPSRKPCTCKAIEKLTAYERSL